MQVREAGGRFMSVEFLDPKACGEVVNEKREFLELVPRSRGYKSGYIECETLFRFGFFKTKELNEDAFLGYAILGVYTSNIGFDSPSSPPRIVDVPNRVTRVLESIIRLNEGKFCVPRLPEWRCRVGRKLLSIKGIIYSEPCLGLTSVCAHSAIKAVASAWGVDLEYPEINRVLELKTLYKTHVGLSGNQIRQAIKKLCPNTDTKTIGYPAVKGPIIGPAKFIYTGIESGFPALLHFKLSEQSLYGHVVPVLGHVFDTDAWVAKAEHSYRRSFITPPYLPSELWNVGFVIHDDNFGSNFHAPRHYMRSLKRKENVAEPDEATDRPTDNAFPAGKKNSSEVPSTIEVESPSEVIIWAIVTHPKEVAWDSNIGELVTVGLLSGYLEPLQRKITQHRIPKLSKASVDWGQRLLHALKNKCLVVRSFLTDRESYLSHLRQIRDWGTEGLISPYAIANIRQRLKGPDWNWIWVAEFSVPDLYSGNRRKLGELVITARKGFDRVERTDWAVLRLPGVIVLDASPKEKRPVNQIIFHTLTSGIRRHSALIRCEHLDAKAGN